MEKTTSFTTKTLQIKLPYRPMPKQKEFHGLTAKYRGFCGGWGNGKTSGCAAETFFRLHEFPGTNWVIARKTRPELKSTTWDMFMNGDTASPYGWHGVPRETIKYYNKSDLHIEFHNGSKVWGLPLDDPKKLENYNLGGYWIDQAEEVTEDIFLKFQGRLRQLRAPREGLLAFNPDGHNWLWNRFINPERRDIWKKLYKAIEATTFDNPNLPEDYLEQFEGLPDHWLQRFVYGSHEVFIGQIFTDYNPEIHVVQPFLIPSGWERWMCIDPGIRSEGAISYIARDPLGNAYYYREHLEANRDVSWWAEKIFEVEAQEDIGGPDEEIYRRLIGPEALQRNQTTGKSVLDIYYEHGLTPELADRAPSARISKITEYLRPRAGHRNPWTGDSPAPKFYIFSTCEKMLEYLPQYKWKPVRTNFSEQAPPEEARKRDDHNIDNAGHLILAFDGLPPVSSDGRRASTEAEFLEQHFQSAIDAAKAASAYSLVRVGGDDWEEDEEWE